MKFNVLLAIAAGLFLLTACSTTDSKTKSTTNSSVNAADLSGYELTPYNGNENWQKAIKKDGAGVVLEEGDVKNKQKDGTWVTYHSKDGIVKSVVGYENGWRHGIMIKMSNRGSMTEKGTYVQGKLEGGKFVYENGRLKESANYENGKLNGERIIYYGSGVSGKKIQEEGFFQNGKRHGTNKWFNEAGEVTIEYEYVNGEKIDK